MDRTEDLSRHVDWKPGWWSAGSEISSRHYDRSHAWIPTSFTETGHNRAQRFLGWQTPITFVDSHVGDGTLPFNRRLRLMVPTDFGPAIARGMVVIMTIWSQPARPSEHCALSHLTHIPDRLAAHSAVLRLLSIQDRMSPGAAHMPGIEELLSLSNRLVNNRRALFESHQNVEPRRSIAQALARLQRASDGKPYNESPAPQPRTVQFYP